MEQQTSKQRSTFKFGWKAWLVLVLVVASFGTAAYFWNEAREANSRTPEATEARNAEETEKVVAELKQILLIEDTNDPTVARVEDPSVLQQSNPDFYKNAQTGDYLVLYPTRAIIYRSEGRQIINVAPVINANNLTQDQVGESSDGTSDNQASEDSSQN